ncbi:MAG: hypothetical protein ABSG74_06230 [Candidatus Bathyarchaeia archaeon]|jgi:hypothetical protein
MTQTPPTWEEYYKAKHDELTHTLGKLETIDRRKYDPAEWDAETIRTCRDLLELLNILRKDAVGTIGDVKSVEERMYKLAEAHVKYIDKQDATLKSAIEEVKQDTKATLKAIQTWMENWEPLLKLVREDYHDKLERVEKVGEHE